MPLPASETPLTLSDQYDVIVLGAGAAGMTASAAAATLGMSVLLLEKTSQVGGTTAVSGGMVWVPGNAKAAAVGQPDSLDAARLYLDATVTGMHNAAVRDNFLTHAAGAVAWLEAQDIVHLQPVALYPDYYPDLPGAALGGRVLEPVPFDARHLGRAFALLRPPLPEFTLFGGMMVPRADLVHFRNVGQSVHATRRVAALVGRHVWQRLSYPRGTSLVLGNALAAQLLHAVLRLRVALRLNCAVERLLLSSDGVAGVVIGGQPVRATRGVVVATGGFSHHTGWRQQLLPASAGRLSAAHSGDSGDGIDLCVAAGGVVERCGSGGAFWAPVSRFTRPNGEAGLFPHTVTDRGKPGCLAVNGQAHRFVNEALSYHEFVRAMLRDRNAPAFLIADSQFLWRYGLGAIRPFTLALHRWERTGYLIEAPDIGALAHRLHLPPDALAETVDRFNRFARVGEDPDFRRGGDAYQRYLGDPQHGPNPSLRPLDRPPFYAVVLYPADLGTSTGLATDASARVLDAEDIPIPGLYACGNDMNSVMNGAYPGPGITLGPALTFGFLAAERLGRGVRTA